MDDIFEHINEMHKKYDSSKPIYNDDCKDLEIDLSSIFEGVTKKEFSLGNNIKLKLKFNSIKKGKNTTVKYKKDNIKTQIEVRFPDILKKENTVTIRGAGNIKDGKTGDLIITFV